MGNLAHSRGSCLPPIGTARGAELPVTKPSAFEPSGCKVGWVGKRVAARLHLAIDTPIQRPDGSGEGENRPPGTEAEVRTWLSGNLCRCTGYQNIVDAVLLAAERMRRAP